MRKPALCCYTNFTKKLTLFRGAGVVDRNHGSCTEFYIFNILIAVNYKYVTLENYIRLFRGALEFPFLS